MPEGKDYAMFTFSQVNWALEEVILLKGPHVLAWVGCHLTQGALGPSKSPLYKCSHFKAL